MQVMFGEVGIHQVKGKIAQVKYKYPDTYPKHGLPYQVNRFFPVKGVVKIKKHEKYNNQMYSQCETHKSSRNIQNGILKLYQFTQ